MPSFHCSFSVPIHYPPSEQVDTKKAGIAKKGRGFLMGKGKKAKLLKALQAKKTGAGGMDVDPKKKLTKKKK